MPRFKGWGRVAKRGRMEEKTKRFHCSVTEVKAEEDERQVLEAKAEDHERQVLQKQNIALQQKLEKHKLKFANYRQRRSKAAKKSRRQLTAASGIISSAPDTPQRVEIMQNAGSYQPDALAALQTSDPVRYSAYVETESALGLFTSAAAVTPAFTADADFARAARRPESKTDLSRLDRARWSCLRWSRQ